MRNHAPSKAGRGTSLPVVTVAMWNGEGHRVKYTEVHSEGANDVVAVIMLSAASVYTLKHTYTWITWNHFTSIIFVYYRFCVLYT